MHVLEGVEVYVISISISMNIMYIYIVSYLSIHLYIHTETPTHVQSLRGKVWLPPGLPTDVCVDAGGFVHPAPDGFLRGMPCD